MGYERRGFPNLASSERLEKGRNPRSCDQSPPPVAMAFAGLFRMRPEGLEPPTIGSEDRGSIQLSYGRLSIRKTIPRHEGAVNPNDVVGRGRGATSFRGMLQTVGPHKTARCGC